MLTFRWEELDYGPYLEVWLEAPRAKLHGWDGQGDMHPFWYTYCTYSKPITDDSVERGYELFTLGDDTMDLNQIVVDNPVTRAIIDAIQNIDSLETGHTTKESYLGVLIDILVNFLWD